MVSESNIGFLLKKLRKESKMSLKEVADQIGIDVSMLSKIEHGERQVQSHMLLPLSKVFKTEFKDFQILYLNQKLEKEFGGQPYLKESLKKYLQKIEAS